MEEINIFWFRRDLRLEDNHALFLALKAGKPVLPLFIFDTDILNSLPKTDSRVSFIYFHLQNINQRLRNQGFGLKIMHGQVLEVWKELIQHFRISEVFCNHDYEPEAILRDQQVFEFLQVNGIRFEQVKDQVVFEKSEVVKDDQKPYTVFTPYSKKWKVQLENNPISFYQSENHLGSLYFDSSAFPSLESLGFERQSNSEMIFQFDSKLIESYELNRDFPAQNACSRVGVHLRFGTISIRTLVEKVKNISEKFLNELIWREFYMQILWHFPRVQTESFVKVYDLIPWNQDVEAFEKWKKGQTGIPLVDAGMRELAQTGYMHNRVRMVTASFLTKNLMMNWRLGEAWFAEKLLDFELSSNNGSWQWCAGSGVDAAPYFRVFNPILQQKKFDPQEKYIQKWVPEYNTTAYPKPIVDLSKSRENYLAVVKKTILNQS